MLFLFLRENELAIIFLFIFNIIPWPPTSLRKIGGGKQLLKKNYFPRNFLFFRKLATRKIGKTQRRKVKITPPPSAKSEKKGKTREKKLRGNRFEIGISFFQNTSLLSPAENQQRLE